jgi:ribosome-associated protein
MSEEKTLDALMQVIRSAMEDLKAVNIEEIDVRDKTSMTEMMVVATGTSSRHVKAIADNVLEKAKENHFRPLGSEGEEMAEWVLIDLGDVIVHVMQSKIRDFYQIEKLWKVGVGNREILS